MTAFNNLTDTQKTTLLQLASSTPTPTLFELEHIINTYSAEKNLPLHEVAHYIYMSYCVFLSEHKTPPLFNETNGKADSK